MSNLRQYFDRTAQEILLHLREENLHYSIERMCEKMGTTVAYYGPMETGEKPLTDGIIARVVNVSHMTWHDRMELYDMLLEKAGKVTGERELFAAFRTHMKALPVQFQDKKLLEAVDNMLYEALERE